MDRCHEALFDLDRVDEHLGNRRQKLVVHEAAETTLCSIDSPS
jgi:hypothetical protein